MRLHRLLGPGVSVRGAGWQEVEITALSADSRAVRPGTLFAAMPGSRADGRAFVDDAVARGAVAVLSDPSLAGRSLPVPLILDDNPRRFFAGDSPPKPESALALGGAAGSRRSRE